MPALCSHSCDGVCLFRIASHINDIIWACDPEADFAIDHIKKERKFGALDEGTFRFCGIEIAQSDDGVIRVACEQTTKKLENVRMSADRAQRGDLPATQEEQEGLRSCSGGLMWISRFCSPGISYQVSMFQTAVNKPLVEDIVQANRTVPYIQEIASRGMVFRPGLLWPSRETIAEHGSFPRICSAVVSDASHGGEDEWLDEWREREAFHSQGA